MPTEWNVTVALIDGVRLVNEGPDALAIEAPATAHRARAILGGLTPGLRAAIERLTGEGSSVPYLTAFALQEDGPGGIAGLQGVLRRLWQHALLAHNLRLDERPIATLYPLSAYYRYAERRLEPGRAYALSRFACVRSRERRMVLESPLGYAEVRLHAAPTLAALHALAQPQTPETLAAEVPDLGEEGAALFMNLLANAGALTPVASDDTTPETSEATLAQWDFHDLLFHTRSRLGRHANEYGGTYPFKDVFAALPVLKPAMSDDIVALYRPDLDQLAQSDPTFTRVLEARTSLRAHGDPPISVRQLGEFLHRAAHIKKLAAEAGVSFRPHPGGGAIHELEIYPLVERCDGLQPGLYHYNALEHHLERISGPTPITNAILDMAGITGTLPGRPQVLLVLAARFQRMQNKYQSMTYAVILKNVGALYQTMYLAATAMGLAPCALGGGHSDLFAQAAGLDYCAETSVGEFMLGSAGGE